MDYAFCINQILARLASTKQSGEEDRLWNAWLDLKEQEPRDLQTLLNSEIRKEFKARALVVLLAPDLGVLPFRWYEQSSLQDYLSGDWIEWKNLTLELVTFAGELVCQNIDYVTKQQDLDSRFGLLREYNKVIIDLLTALPEEDDVAIRLFSYYQINDLVPYSNMEDASGYNPLYCILASKDVPMKWKWLADKQMRDRIIAEAEGREKPRKDWEIPLMCYTRHIQMANYDGKSAYARDLFISQIRFVVELPRLYLQRIEKCGYDKSLFYNWQIVHIMGALAGDDLRDLRHKFARYVILGNTEEYESFSIHDSESRRASNLILQEFGAEDLQLATRLNYLIAKANERETKNTNTQRKQQQKINDVLNQMK